MDGADGRNWPVRLSLSLCYRRPPPGALAPMAPSFCRCWLSSQDSGQHLLVRIFSQGSCHPPLWAHLAPRPPRPKPQDSAQTPSEHGLTRPLLSAATPQPLALGGLGTHPACHPGLRMHGAKPWPVPSFRNLPSLPFLRVSSTGDASPRGSHLTFRVLPHGGQIFTRETRYPSNDDRCGIGKRCPVGLLSGPNSLRGPRPCSALQRRGDRALRPPGRQGRGDPHCSAKQPKGRSGGQTTDFIRPSGDACH